MKTFEFNLQGGITVTFGEDALTIKVAGVKGWIFHKLKPYETVIPYEDVLQVDYKGAGITIGYIRFITKPLAAYPSSMYVAQSCPNSIIFEKEEMDTFNALMDEIQRVFPHVPKEVQKM